MKKLFAIILAVILVVSLVGCEKRSNISEEEIEEHGYIVIDDSYFDAGAYNVKLVYDIRTKIEYLMQFGGYGIALCPYYDETGNVVIYEGD